MIELKSVSKSFGNEPILDNINLIIDDGEFVIFKGPSGCGKTTLLNMIGSIEPFDSGEILINGLDVSNKKNRQVILSQEVGFLFQEFALVEDKTVKQNLAYVKKKNRTEINMVNALEFVGLNENILNRKIYTLSGGEQQRVAVARLILKKCNIILADEPTGSLDRDNVDLIFNLLEQINESGKTIVLVTHDQYLCEKGKRIIEIEKNFKL